MIGEFRIMHPPTNQFELARNGIKLRDFVFLHHGKPPAKVRILLEQVPERLIRLRLALSSNLVGQPRTA